MSHRKSLNHICSVCDEVYTDVFSVLQCFFSHQGDEGYIDPAPEDYIEMITRMCLEKIPVPDLIDLSFDNLVELAKSIDNARNSEKPIQQQPLAEKLAAVVVSVRTLCFMFCDVDEMNILIEQYAREIEKKYGL